MSEGSGAVSPRTLRGWRRSKTMRAAGNMRPPPPHTLGRLPVSDYLLQQPEPQHSSRAPAAPTVGHSSTQHSHKHTAQSQVPVSQQPQQSQMGQPQSRLPSIAGTKGTRPSVAQRMKLFMEKPLCMMKKLNRSRHVTTCERGKARGRSIQFRQTPKRIRTGRIGMASDSASYSRPGKGDAALFSPQKRPQERAASPFLSSCGGEFCDSASG